MEKEYISYEEVKSDVDRIMRCSKTMEDIFDGVTGKMNSMTADDVFQGRAKEALVQAFAPFKNDFKNYVAKVQEFGTAFTKAGEALQETESQLQSQASDL